jgi:hypothetical protein
MFLEETGYDRSSSGSSYGLKAAYSEYGKEPSDSIKA